MRCVTVFFSNLWCVPFINPKHWVLSFAFIYLAASIITTRIGYSTICRICNSTAILVLQGHKSKITSLQFNFKDSVIASGSENGEIRLHDVVTGIASSPLVVPKAQVFYGLHQKSCTIFTY